jgi:hypothetical protein
MKTSSFVADKPYGFINKNRKLNQPRKIFNRMNYALVKRKRIARESFNDFIFSVYE